VSVADGLLPAGLFGEFPQGEQGFNQVAAWCHSMSPYALCDYVTACGYLETARSYLFAQRIPCSLFRIGRVTADRPDQERAGTVLPPPTGWFDRGHARVAKSSASAGWVQSRGGVRRQRAPPGGGRWPPRDGALGFAFKPHIHDFALLNEPAQVLRDQS
jgi:hypothetical protein